jgi:ferredoxin
MLHELAKVLRFSKWISEKKSPTDWQTYLELTSIWAPFVDGMARASTMPGMEELTSHLKPESTDFTWVPINKRLETQNSTVLPLDMLKELVAKSSHRAIVRQCVCRQAFGCEHYPIDIGCIYLGDSTKDFDPALALHATADQAIEHIDKAINAGLVTDVGQVDFDADLFGVGPKSHFGIVCFCCDCCCLARRYSGIMPERLLEFQYKLEGLSVKVNENCTGCGLCVDRCFVSAISLKDDKAVINEDRCKGCGVCVEQCRKNAITIEVTDGEKMRKSFFDRIESRIDVYSSIPGKEVNMTPAGRIPHPRHGLKIPKYRHSRETVKVKQED